ncbi:uncharacterized protein LOC130233471 isoform X2 [Danio aesculapii]|uniref:uncharacterized protein LOC130233471 isoform X2 n=1 Tax=Danio aesculapii TaxID=1142201 RepID=UPI0024BF9D05|nr:uncharacterized protein LOC130233471 isoform X2 [Danio aesculapii]
MKMFLLGYSAAALCLVLFASGAVSAVDVTKAVGDEVSFSPASVIPPGASIIWKHRSASGSVIKAIEYDEDGTQTRNPNFQGITTLNEKTGKITIKGLKLVHSGVYTIDINSKEQEQKFSLTVKERVPKPTITTEKSVDLKAAYLTCKYAENVTMELSIIWKNSTGEIKTFTSNEQSQFITVHSTGNPKNYYTCTLDNIASAETSDPVREEELFKEESSSGPGLTIFIVIFVIFVLISVIVAALYKWKPDIFKEHVPCLKGQRKLDPENINSGEGTATEGQRKLDPENINSGDGMEVEVRKRLMDENSPQTEGDQQNPSAPSSDGGEGTATEDNNSTL